MSAEVPGWALGVLSSIGLTNPDPSDSLHVRLVNAVLRVGVGKSQGAYLSALRFEFNWEHEQAGMTFAKSKAAFEHSVDRRKVEEMAKPREDGRKMSLGWAEAIAEDAAYEHKLAFLMAEQRERSMRQFLQTIAGALDNHRTDRADLRAADAAHAQGMTGGA